MPIASVNNNNSQGTQMPAPITYTILIQPHHYNPCGNLLVGGEMPQYIIQPSRVHLILY